MLNLRDFRENKLKMTQEQFAHHLDVRQDKISRWEAEPGDIPISILQKIAEKFGLTLDELCEYEKPRPEPLQVPDTWKEAELLKKILEDYLKDYKQDKSTWDAYEKSGEYETEYRNIIDTYLQKPKIAILGPSDTGKSSLINALLGAEKTPTAWTPTTSIIVHIKHINDRPDYINDDVWIFREEDEGQFDLSYLTKSYLNKRYREQAESIKIAGGSLEVLKDFGTKQGDHYADNATAAVVYVDSVILQNIDLIDFPGFGTGNLKEDNKAWHKITSKFYDVLIYLSPANAFMRGSDISYLRQAIPTLPFIYKDDNNKDDNNKIIPLGNLFILASQAHIIDGGNKYQLKMILDNGCTRFEQSLPGTLADFFKVRSETTHCNCEDNFRFRFFYYTKDIPGLRKDFEDALRPVIEYLPKQRINMTKEILGTSYKEAWGKTLKDAIDSYKRLIKDKENEEKILEEILKNEPARQAENKKKRDSIIKEIEEYRQASKVSFEKNYNNIVTVNHIVDTIKERGFKNKKEDHEALASNISAQLDSALQSIFGEYSERLKTMVKDYIAGFETSYKVNGKLGVNASFTFDAERAFACGLAGAATFGGLAIWAASLGNLGAYILVAKGVSILSALGISITGGTAGATAAVASIGGPVILGIFISVFVAFAGYNLLSGGWEKSIAKNLVKAYEKQNTEEQNALEQYRGFIEKSWDNIITEFNAGADKMEKGWQDEIANKKALLNNYDVEDIQRHIKAAENARDFLSDIPL